MITVTQDIFQQQALMIRHDLLQNDAADVDKEVMKLFSASIDWVQKFVKRHSIDSVSLHGLAGVADIAAAANYIAEFRRCLSSF